MSADWIKIDVSGNKQIQKLLKDREAASKAYRATEEYKAFQDADDVVKEAIAKAVAQEGRTVSVAVKPWGVAVKYGTAKAAKAAIKI